MATHCLTRLKKTLFLGCIIALSFEGVAADSSQRKQPFSEVPSSVTQHQIVIQGKRIDYTATTGHLTLWNSEGTEWAHFFYVAYTALPSSKSGSRPITFAFNGGPGSSSIWLHMGALGPKRVAMNDDGSALPPPFGMVDNEYSWLDKTDLVFIDPIETGFSRPAEGVKKAEFTGYDEDIKSVGDFIYHYTTQNNRWSDPKYLAGESYGTTRATGLSGYLQDRHGMYLNGLILVSAVLNFQTLYFTEGNDLPYSLFLPSYAAAAWHHNKIDSAQFGSLSGLLTEAERFASHEYTMALMKGDALQPSEFKEVARQMAALTGLDPEFISNHNLRVSTAAFTKELLRKEGYTIGRFDALVKGIDQKNAGDSYDFDPSYNLTILGTYTAALHAHLSQNLKYQNPKLTYEVLTSRVRPWNYGPAQNRFLNTSQTLQRAMHKNPHLKVLVCSGYFDLATPYFATDYTLNHLFLDPQIKKNIQVQYYLGGHMMYTMKSELQKFTQDVKAFYEKN